MEPKSRSSMTCETSVDSKTSHNDGDSRNITPLHPASLANHNAASLVASRPRTHYMGELVWQAFQVDDTVYCGGLDAVLNLTMLCRLNIEYIVDLSGVDEDTMPRNRRGECPCLCSRRTAHSRVIMAINVLEEKPGQPYKQDLIPYFEDFIALIAKAKALKKCVLVHSHYGRNRAPAFTAAYLMHEIRCTRVQALARVNDCMSKTRPGLCISDTLQRALMRWQTVLGIRAADSGGSTDERLSVPLFSIKRTAWT
uniref:protein-tyrosine-phosphatase n=1 Tax=Ascaris lumbricoides TaxID=6252 RepID=A0A0M3IQR4_ASCLU